MQSKHPRLVKDGAGAVNFSKPFMVNFISAIKFETRPDLISDVAGCSNGGKRDV
jgi:hypothetical protein